VILAAVYPASGQDPDGTAADVQPDLKRAGEHALLLGCGSELPAAQEVFVEAYCRLIRYAIARLEVPELGDPSADDVFQEVSMRLFRRLSSGLTLERGSLSTYVWRTAYRTCREMLKARSAAPRAELPEMVRRIWPRPLPQALLPQEVLEAWEDLDGCLVRSHQGDLINRILLAHRGLKGRFTGRKYPVKRLRSDWRWLASRPEDQLSELHGQVAAEAQRFADFGEVRLAGQFINDGRAEIRQLAVLLAAASGLDLQQMRQLLDELAGLSETAIFTRYSRMGCALIEPAENPDQHPEEQDDLKGN